MAALKQNGLVIDLMLLLFSPAQAESLSSGTRMSLAVEPPEVFTRLKPTQDGKRRVLAGAARLNGAKAMAVASRADPSLECQFGALRVLTGYGIADGPAAGITGPADSRRRGRTKRLRRQRLSSVAAPSRQRPGPTLAAERTLRRHGRAPGDAGSPRVIGAVHEG